MGLAEQDPLTRYCLENRGSGSYEVSRFPGFWRLSLNSQIWQGRAWRHMIEVVDPPTPARSNTMILEITGDRARDADLEWARRTAALTGLRTSVLYNIPSQPIWSMVEDDLIAHTLDQYLAGEGDDWPLLMPMVHAVREAMSALEAVIGASKFVVTGASKRGWTTWLAGSMGDARIAGMAPRVFDNLDFATQLKRQNELWGECSPMIEDYVIRGLHTAPDYEAGQNLLKVIDPIYRVDQITSPLLVLAGSNDPYWPVDAMGLYWDRLKTMPKASLVVPNAGHGLQGSLDWTDTFAAFAKSCAGLAEFPFDQESAPVSAESWTADSDEGRFEEAEWTVGRSGQAVLKTEQWRQGDLSFWTSGQVRFER